MSGPITHGATRTREYRVWVDMFQRCCNPRNRRYFKYGGRGIKICQRWHDFALFLADMGHRPSSGHSIDRVNNDGGYEPSNCRWATRSEQQRNKGAYPENHKIPKGKQHWTNKDRTRAATIARENIRGAHHSGAENNNAKITQDIADAMRAKHAENPNLKMADLGHLFGMGREQTRKIIRGVAWQ